ncbi:tyrosine-type recombinase/integrase [Phocaeicola vulgatus]
MSCHQLRHSRAMNLQEEGVILVWIRDLLGHESVQSTEIYAR